MHVIVIGALGEVGLNLDGLLDRLGRRKLLERCRTIFKSALRIIGHFGCDRLPTLVPIAEDLHNRIDVSLANLLNILQIVDHEMPIRDDPLEECRITIIGAAP